MVLCRYGIEYVEDPATHKRVPTINRAQFTSVFDDDNYKSAIQYADMHQRAVYENEAKAINEIQKNILAISQKEEPFDVFICYKETDSQGRRTPDSVLANELYHQLVQEGFKVFFSRITLEDKLGYAYEPYIFAALNSARVMVVLGTKPEYFKAVWVRNEWSRYLSLIRQGQKKMLIPAYKDMDPYDLPEEFSHLQAQDMAKLGFMQDLIRGIKKIAQADAPKATVVKETVVSAGNVNTKPLLKRAFMFLEDGDWSSANEYCEKVLDNDPENALAYLGKLMAELRVRYQGDLKDQAEPFDGSNNYKKVVRFADEKLRNTIVGYIKHINDRNENARLNGIYVRAKNAMLQAKTENAYKEAARMFLTVSEYMDSSELAKSCYEKAETARKDAILALAKGKMEDNAVSEYEAAIKLFMSIPGWRDADESVLACKKKIEELEAAAEAARKRAKKIARRKKIIAVSAALTVCAAIALTVVLNKLVIPSYRYNKAVDLMNAGEYEDAIAIFDDLDGFKNSKSERNKCLNAIKYNEAIAWLEEGKYLKATAAFEELGDYKDSAEKASLAYLKYKQKKLNNANVGDYVYFGTYEQDNNIDNGKEDIEWLVLDKKDGKVLVISKYALDGKQYNTSHTSVTWETCSLREWLNNDFINGAFSENEKMKIPTVTVSAHNNPDYSTDPGSETQDKAFLLSITEVNEYLGSSGVIRCGATDYAVANGVHINGSTGNCWWWLRTPGNSREVAAFGGMGGTVDNRGYSVNYNYLGVRPAIWIDLDA